MRVSIEANHALLAGHTFEHEIALAGSLSLLSSLDMNHGDALLGWKTDPFLNNLLATAMSMYQMLKAEDIGKGGLTFDAKVRRQSFTPKGLIEAHVGGTALCARAFLLAARLMEGGEYDRIVADRYAGWQTPEEQDMLGGKLSLKRIAEQAEVRGLNPMPRSRRQERIENLPSNKFFSWMERLHG